MPPPSLDLDKGLIALGQAIRATRTARKLTQEELARRADLDVSYISVIERGRRNPKWGAVRRIGSGLEMPLVELARLAEEIERDL